MTQPPPPGPGPEGSDQPTQHFGVPDGEQPTQSFGVPDGEQPTQSFGAPEEPLPVTGPAHGPGPGGGPGAEDQGSGRRSTAVIVGVIVALVVLAALVFAGIRLFGGDQEADDEPGTLQQTDPPPADADPDDGTDADGTEGTDPDGEPGETDTDGDEPQTTSAEPDQGGELHDYLTGAVEAVEGQQTSWTIDPPGWQQYQDLQITPAEAYTATFTSTEEESLTMWAARLDDVDEAVAFAEDLVAERGEADESGEVWQIDDDEQIDDDLAYGEYHLWQDGEDIEILWWDDTGVVRHVSGPAEETWDFYLWAGI